MAVVYCVSLLAYFGMVRSSNFELLRAACPFSNFCTKNSLQNITTTEDNRACCYDCFCDEHCSMFEDCCPDIELNKAIPNTAVLYCKQVHIVTERTKMNPLIDTYITVQENIRYRVIDFCPSAYQANSDVDAKCNGDFGRLPEFEDLVLVSDSNGRVFKNKHCALCNGVLDTIRWSLKIVKCVRDLHKVQLTLSEATFFVLNYCLVTSERPQELQITGRNLPCPNVIECLENNSNFEEECINGPYMPYLNTRYMLTIYKNVFCYKFCTGKLEEKICPHYSDSRSMFGALSYQMLLDLRPMNEHKHFRKTDCREAKLIDPYSGKCELVYCPPFEAVSYGRCIPLSNGVRDLYVTVNVIYKLKDNDTKAIIEASDLRFETVQQIYLKQIKETFRYITCKIGEITLQVKTGRESRRFEQLLLTIKYATNEQCTMNDIGAHIKRRQGFAGDAAWLIQNQTFEMEGRFTFYENVFADEIFHSHHFLILPPTTRLPVSIEEFFICPYFRLTLKEYVDHVERSGKNRKEYSLLKISPWSTFPEGFYPISSNKVAVCIDTYVARSGKAPLRIYIDLFLIYLITIQISV